MNEPRREALASLFGGQLSLVQFDDGHRAGTDAVLLAAAADLAAGQRFIDVGSGVGTVGLWLGLQRQDACGVLLESEHATADLARRNAAANGLANRIDTLCADLFDRAACRAAGLDGSGDLVMTNPPFYRAGTVRMSPHAGKAHAHVTGGTDADPHAAWIRRCADLLRPKGRLLAIHRPEAMPSLLAGLQGRVGGVRVLPIYPKPGQAAVRVLVGGIAGSRAPLAVLPGLHLHEADGRFTPEAEAVHRGKPLSFWPAGPERRRPPPAA